MSWKFVQPLERKESKSKASLNSRQSSQNSNLQFISSSLQIVMQLNSKTQINQCCDPNHQNWIKPRFLNCPILWTTDFLPLPNMNLGSFTFVKLVIFFCLSRIGIKLSKLRNYVYIKYGILWWTFWWWYSLYHNQGLLTSVNWW